MWLVLRSHYASTHLVADVFLTRQNTHSEPVVVWHSFIVIRRRTASKMLWNKINSSLVVAAVSPGNVLNVNCFYHEGWWLNFQMRTKYVGVMQLIANQGTCAVQLVLRRGLSIGLLVWNSVASNEFYVVSAKENYILDMKGFGSSLW